MGAKEGQEAASAPPADAKVQGMEAGSMSSAEKTAEATAPDKERPVYVCDRCGSLKPGEPVYQCTICMKYVCVRHLDQRFHECSTGYT